MEKPSAPFTTNMLEAQRAARAGDRAGERAALDAALAIEPRHMLALIARGDWARRDGDMRGAASFYHLALANPPASPPPAVAAAIDHARRALAEANGGFETHLEARLAAAGFGAGTRSERLDEALDILNGRRAVFVQQPTSLYFPGLPNRQFYAREEFAWLPAIEAAASSMRAELEAVIASETGFRPYVQGEANRPNRGHALLGDPRWSAFHLWEDGAPVPANAARCPATMATLRHAPIPIIAGRSPMALFSVLRPGTHIPPHTGMLNTRLIVHIPLIVPQGCRLRVGNETRAVEAGKALIFDDSIEHEAWNDGAETRVVLLFEIWRPELSDDERAGLTALFEAIGSYG